MIYTYKVLSYHEAIDTQGLLNKLGEDGWELILIYKGKMFLKRLIKEGIQIPG